MFLICVLKLFGIYGLYIMSMRGDNVKHCEGNERLFEFIMVCDSM